MSLPPNFNNPLFNPNQMPNLNIPALTNIPRMLMSPATPNNFFGIQSAFHATSQNFSNINPNLLLSASQYFNSAGNNIQTPNLTSASSFVPYLNLLLSQQQQQANILNNSTYELNSSHDSAHNASTSDSAHGVKLKSRLIKRHLEDNIDAEHEDHESNYKLEEDVNKSVDLEAPFGRSKRGKPLKRPTFIPSYMTQSRDNGTNQCVVCEQTASGLHYKAMTCEGCKGFFRRTIQQKLSYECRYDGNCCVSRREDGPDGDNASSNGGDIVASTSNNSQITRGKRDVCRSCRWKKCVAAGMDSGSVLNEAERRAKNELIRVNKEKRMIQMQRHQLHQQQKQKQQPIKLERSLTDQSESISDNFHPINSPDNSQNGGLNDLLLQLQNVTRHLPNSDKLVSLETEKERRTEFFQSIESIIKSLPGFEKISSELRTQLISSTKGVQATLALSLFTYSPLHDCLWLPGGQCVKDSYSNMYTLLTIAKTTYTSLEINQLEQLILFALILLVDTNLNDDLANLEIQYLNLYNHLTMTNKVRGSKILTLILPELRQLALTYLSSTNQIPTSSALPFNQSVQFPASLYNFHVPQRFLPNVTNNSHTSCDNDTINSNIPDLDINSSSSSNHIINSTTIKNIKLEIT